VWHLWALTKNSTKLGSSGERAGNAAAVRYCKTAYGAAPLLPQIGVWHASCMQLLLCHAAPAMCRCAVRFLLHACLRPKFTLHALFALCSCISPCRLWEYDPSVRPAGITDAADDDELHATSDDNMGRRLSQGSVSSAESRAPSIIASPHGGSSDMGSDGRQSLTKPSGVALTAAAAAGLAGAAGGAALSPAAAASGPDGWLWHCENPFKVGHRAACVAHCCGT
jgi:hypothetical protein